MINSWIQKTNGVCGGSACIKNTRIPVWLIISLINQKTPIEELIENYYPSLIEEDIKVVLDYYKYNKEEIDEEIRANDEDY